MVARKDNAERILTSQTSSLDLEFNVAAGRFDDQDHRREWILNERVKTRAGSFRNPVDTTRLDQTAQNLGFEIRQQFEGTLDFVFDSFDFGKVDVFNTVALVNLTQNFKGYFLRRTQVTGKREFTVLARDAEEITQNGVRSLISFDAVVYPCQPAQPAAKFGNKASNVGGCVSFLQHRFVYGIFDTPLLEIELNEQGVEGVEIPGIDFEYLVFEDESGEATKIPGKARSLFADRDQLLAKILVVRVVTEKLIDQFEDLRRIMKL